MFLDVGNIERIEEPTDEQVGYHLRNLPASAPFLILNADESLFIQATPSENAYRVELWQDERGRYTMVQLDQAEKLLQAFRRWDETETQKICWEPISQIRDPHRQLLLASIVILALAAFCLFRALH